ncbi:MAG: transglycosylase SLT domain-containing protein [Hyphomicrobiales bacterium]
MTKNVKSMAVAMACAASLLMGPVVPAEAGSSDPSRMINMISAAAPQYGVPAWFALRIAKIESNYNPRARGSRGELGLFQLKCATAGEVGFRGNCSDLLDPATNIRYGLKHLALAIKKSNGNLQLAASKHNGGLSRKTLVASYVAKVF